MLLCAHENPCVKRVERVNEGNSAFCAKHYLAAALNLLPTLTFTP